MADECLMLGSHSLLTAQHQQLSKFALNLVKKQLTTGKLRYPLDSQDQTKGVAIADCCPAYGLRLQLQLLATAVICIAALKHSSCEEFA